MIFYVALAVMFTVYGLDLLWLVVVSFVARSHEIATLMIKRSKSSDIGRCSSRLRRMGSSSLNKLTAHATAKAAKATAKHPPMPVVPGKPAAEPSESVCSGTHVARVGAAAQPVSPGAATAATAYMEGPATISHSNSDSNGHSHSPASSSLGSGSPDMSDVVVVAAEILGENLGNVDVAKAEAKVQAATNAAVAALAEAAAAPVVLVHPKVLIQLPMFNEEAHADVIIKNCCNIEWPADRVLIQVLDDSTKEHIRAKVDQAAQLCVEAGHMVQVLRRTNRAGFKAGAMVEGLKHVEGQGFEYVAIFDADFDPPADFLQETIFPLDQDKRLAFVQTRWACSSNSFLTWAQKVNLEFHFDVEQRARSYLGWFFNFNGTAGVWRIEAIHDAGGWQSDTVVEDMDLSLRCYLRGWTALYLSHVDNPNELPADLSTYKTQQFRWLAGPMQILCKAFMHIWHAKDISFWKRLNCYWFFMRYVLFAAITICVLAVPPVAIWLDRWEWQWPEIYFLVAINFALAVYLYITPFSIAYLLFSVAIGYFKGYAMLSGLVGAEKSKKWKVTAKGVSTGGWKDCLSRIRRPYACEMCLCIYYTGMAAACFVYADWMLGGYCVVMAVVFLVIAFGDCFM